MSKSCQELASYRFARIAGPDADGYERVELPGGSTANSAVPLKAASMALRPPTERARSAPWRAGSLLCEETITVPPQVNEKTRQKHPFPSTAFSTRTRGARRPSGHMPPL